MGQGNQIRRGLLRHDEAVGSKALLRHHFRQAPIFQHREPMIVGKRGHICRMGDDGDLLHGLSLPVSMRFRLVTIGDGLLREPHGGFLRARPADEAAQDGRTRRPRSRRLSRTPPPAGRARIQAGTGAGRRSSARAGWCGSTRRSDPRSGRSRREDRSGRPRKPPSPRAACGRERSRGDHAPVLAAVITSDRALASA